MRTVSIVLFAAIALCSAVAADPTIFGNSGLLMIPNDVVVRQNGFSIGAKSFHSELPDTDEAFRFYSCSLNIGVWKNLEAGACLLDPKDGGSKLLINAKYLALPETLNRPSIAVGVVDAASQLDEITGCNDDPGFYVVASKNLTPEVETVAKKSIRPVRGTLGFGTGIYNGVLAGLDFLVTPKTGICLEYLNSGLRDRSTFNAALRYRPALGFAVEGGLINFEDASLGVSYEAVKF